MAFNQAQFFDGLEKITQGIANSQQPQSDFILDFLALLDISKTTLNDIRNQNTRTNVAKNLEFGEVALKHKIYFKPIGKNYGDLLSDSGLTASEQLENALQTLKTDPLIKTHKIRIIIVTDFQTLLAYDVKTDDTLDVEFVELDKDYAFFLPLVGLERAKDFSEHPADVKASEKMGRLFDFIKRYNEFDTKDDIHALNIFLTRLLFCFFAEDTGIFDKDSFFQTLQATTQADGSDTNTFLHDLFEVLDLPMDSPQRADKPSHLTKFPYVNGELFREQYWIPEFNARTRRILLDCARMNWAEINPDIFGSMFQAVIDTQQRGNLGQHYTSVSNIMKVIEPLFLQGLRAEYEQLASLSNDNAHKNQKAKRLDELLTRLGNIKVFDPACGSGNFLIIAYKELRELEINIWQAKLDVMKGNSQNLAWDFGFDSVVSLDNFFGIEIDDFAVQIARLSLWLAEHQMNVKFHEAFGQSRATLPLKDSGHIVHGNSLRLDWQTVCPNDGEQEIYVVGNPPFGGSGNRSDEQTADMEKVFVGFKKFKFLDFVTAWFWKGANYLKDSHDKGSQAKMALVSTNSIAQGEQVAMLFPYIFGLGVGIGFAYQSFPWKNNAKQNAGVHVVIIGLEMMNEGQKTIYSQVDGIWHSEKVKNISPYLIAGSNVAVESRESPFDSEQNKMIRGSLANDGGNYFLTLEEKNELIKKEPKSLKWIRKAIGSEEFLKGKQRWCLWLNEISPDELREMPSVEKRVENVRNLRLASKKEATRKLAETPQRFDEIKQPKNGNYIVVPRVTSERRRYIPLDFLSHEIICTDRNQMIPNGTMYEFGILNSIIHNEWMRLVTGRLESRYNYSGTIVYNTFPFPTVTDEQKKHIEHLAEEILLTREDFAGETLAKLYDPDTMPESLKIAHQNLDDAVDKLYNPKGFADTASRLAHLLERYETLINAEKQQAIDNKAKKKKSK
ncbi:methyltransferase [Moraxella osloensis]|uniref:site-specific DNA-methyltransferase (adenine-specific) n=1 Tax=Faucicola osloensis TaxID=34062 RepID=A0AA91FPB9_FAUOS|nr:DNA methyltransferase [Moraxella osloensis]OBX62816.1 methyltransferase [Moraxella osloensis]